MSRGSSASALRTARSFLKTSMKTGPASCGADPIRMFKAGTLQASPEDRSNLTDLDLKGLQVRNLHRLDWPGLLFCTRRALSPSRWTLEAPMNTHLKPSPLASEV